MGADTRVDAITIKKALLTTDDWVILNTVTVIRVSGFSHNFSLSVALLHSDVWLLYGPEYEENDFIAQVLRVGHTFLCLHYERG